MTKCVNCRFRAKVDGKEVEGRIAVDGDYLQFFYDNGDIYSIHIPFYWEHGKVDYFDDFELVPRDPESYRDWQVGDIIWDSHESGDNGRIIFRSGKFVAADIDGCVCYTCRELFDEGYRLGLTDIEQQIIEEKKRYEPQDGDVVYAKVRHNDNDAVFIYKMAVENRIYGYAGYNIGFDKMVGTHGFAYITPNILGDLTEYRPATDEEKQMLFEAMAKEGMRWNAEKKVVEDIPKSYEFRKGEPVLVRNGSFETWCIAAYCKPEGTTNRVFVGEAEAFFVEVIPYNERTMHLLGTTEDYKEEQR